MRKKRNPFWIITALFHRLLVIAGSIGLTLLFFLVLPLMQTLNKPPTQDLVVQSMETAIQEAPDPPPEPEPEEEPEVEDQPPELTEQAAPLDLSQLEIALNPGFGGGMMTGDFAVKLNTVMGQSNDVDDIFSMAELDQKPRVIYQPGPMLTKELRKRAPGKVYILFIVDQNGRVANPIVQKSSDPIFEKAALKAVSKWKFEPGKRKGQPVRFRMRVPITFPKGD